MKYITTLAEQAQAYRRDQASLIARRANTFPRNCPVLVNSARYKGNGFAVNVNNPDVPADQLTVMLENGNTWYYPIEDCQRVTWPEVNPSNRRQFMRFRGIKLPAITYGGRAGDKLP